jgi:hypothetical protein
MTRQPPRAGEYAAGLASIFLAIGSGVIVVELTHSLPAAFIATAGALLTALAALSAKRTWTLLGLAAWVVSLALLAAAR